MSYIKHHDCVWQITPKIFHQHFYRRCWHDNSLDNSMPRDTVDIIQNKMLKGKVFKNIIYLFQGGQ